MEILTLGARFREARKSAGLSEADVSKSLGIAESEILAIERDNRGLSASELANAASCLHRSIGFFTEPMSEVREDEFAVRFRSLALDPVDRDAVFAFERSCRAFIWLEDILDIKRTDPPPLYRKTTPTSRQEAEEQGEELAENERNRLELGIDPVRDPFQIVESEGIRVFVRYLETEDISGISHSDETLGACIMVNSAMHQHRRSFDLLHEYAHILVDRPEGTYRIHGQSNHKDVIERRADAFAGAFLLPKEGVHRFLAERGVTRDSIVVSDAFHLMVAFGASFQATVYRLQSLGYLGRKHVDVFLSMKNITRVAERFKNANVIERSDFDSPIQRRFRQLALRAYSKGEISIGRLAELLEIDLVEARAYARLADAVLAPVAVS